MPSHNHMRSDKVADLGTDSRGFRGPYRRSEESQSSLDRFLGIYTTIWLACIISIYIGNVAQEILIP